MTLVRISVMVVFSLWKAFEAIVAGIAKQQANT
jgi:hypothetical protein